MTKTCKKLTSMIFFTISLFFFNLALAKETIYTDNVEKTTKAALILSKSNNILSSIDLDYSSKINNEINNMKNFKGKISDSISISFFNTENDLSGFIEKLEELKREAEGEIIKNKRIMKNLLLTQEDKISIKAENEKLQNSIDKINELLEEIEKIRKERQSVTLTNIKLSLFVIILIIIIIVISIKLKNRSKTNEKIKNSKILQIIKNGNEYYVEYEGIYNKGVKVLESTKSSIKNGVENYVKAVQTLGENRGFLNELEKIDIDIPNLETYGNTIYKLFLNDEIKEKINHQTENLIIKTDEQEIPWEIMHNGKNFLSLKFPISRQIMTREKRKENKIEKNKTPKILFIINPTNNLKETEIEAENIIKKILKKAEIKILKQNNANLINVIGEISKSNYDIIHYGGHSFFDAKNPDEGGLVLANQEILSNTEIKRLLGGNPLIFLNACYSGKSISDNEEYYKNTGEDTIGLASGFYIGGAKGVISSLWNIKDKKASIFATNFYLKLLGGKSVGNALIYAKREAYIYNIKNPTWASFIYYGDPDFKINLK